MTDVILRISGMDCGRARAAGVLARHGAAAVSVRRAESFLPRGWMKYIVKGSAVLVVTLGLSMLVKGIQLFGM